MNPEERFDIRWLLAEGPPVHADQPYGDLTPLNSERTILDGVGATALRDIVEDYLDLLGSSAAVYERNGDYAHGIFASGWCRLLDARSRELAGDCSNAEALAGGAWHCHESCWKTSRTSIETREETDLECHGGIRIFAVPIVAGDEVIGSINFGYGSPPRDGAALGEIAERYQLDVAMLETEAGTYQGRPDHIIALAKKRLRAAARLVGEIVQRRRAEVALRDMNERLESLVAERTSALVQTVRELRAANEELETFAYSVAHDLRGPLRTIGGFARVLQEQSAERLDEKGRHYLDRVQKSATALAELIDDLLALTRISRAEVQRRPVSLTSLAREIADDLRRDDPGRSVEIDVAEGLSASCDRALMAVALGNLMHNAWKFTSPKPHARIEVGQVKDGAFFVRDDGVGFDMKYAAKLFRPFERLHPVDAFEGTGIGLAAVQRVVARHGGRVWAESEPGSGTTVYFTLKGENSGEK